MGVAMTRNERAVKWWEAAPWAFKAVVCVAPGLVTVGIVYGTMTQRVSATELAVANNSGIISSQGQAIARIEAKIDDIHDALGLKRR